MSSFSYCVRDGFTRIRKSLRDRTDCVGYFAILGSPGPHAHLSTRINKPTVADNIRTEQCTCQQSASLQPYIVSTLCAAMSAI